MIFKFIFFYFILKLLIKFIMDSEPRNISISVYEKNKEEISKSDNASQSYIILANEELDNKNKEYLLEIQNLKKEIDNLETDNEKLEVSVTYMRGLLHNFNSKMNHQTKVIKNQKELYNTLKNHTKLCNDEFKKYNEAIYVYYLAFLIIFSIFLILDFVNMYQLCIFTIIDLLKNTVIIVTQKINYKHIVDFKIILSQLKVKLNSLKDKISGEENEINTIDKSNNFIEDHINNL